MIFLALLFYVFLAFLVHLFSYTNYCILCTLWVKLAIPQIVCRLEVFFYVVGSRGLPGDPLSIWISSAKRASTVSASVVKGTKSTRLALSKALVGQGDLQIVPEMFMQLIPLFMGENCSWISWFSYGQAFVMVLKLLILVSFTC